MSATTDPAANAPPARFPNPPQPHTGAPRLARLARKELREILRDRRTIITLVLMPILVYPLLGVTFQKFLFTQLTAPAEVRFRVGMLSRDEAEIFGRVLQRGEERLRGTDALPEDAEPPFFGVEVLNLEQAVRAGEIDIAVRVAAVPDPPPLMNNRPQREYELIYAQNSRIGQEAADYIEERLKAYNDRYIERLLQEASLSTAVPAVIERKAIEATAKPAFSLATLVPLVLILMTVTGAVYPAIDLTAGERERGTLETLIAAPVARIDVLFAKYIAVLAVAILTAVANLVAMSATLYGSGLDRVFLGDGGIPLRVIVQIFALLVVLAGFFSAALLCLTSFARSFKEAQAYLIPLMLVSLAPGILSLMPGLQMNVAYALMPLVNMVLLSRDLLEGHLVPLLAVIAIASTLVYTVLALVFAARIFGTDSVLYGGSETWSDFFARRDEGRGRATLGSAIACLATILPVFIIAGGAAARIEDLPMSARLAVSGTITIALFAVLPMVFAGFNRVNWSDGFRLRRAPIVAYLAAMILGVSLWPFAYELELLLLDPERIEALRAVFEQIKVGLGEVSLPVKLLALAVIPAVCEEFFFRGFLLSGLLGRMRARTAVVISAVLFALFHVFVRDALMFERFPPSLLMGLALGVVAVRTGSVLPGMLLHTLHNGLLLTIAHNEKELAALNFGGDAQQHLPTLWLAAAVAGVVAGTGLLILSTRRRRRTTPAAAPAASAP